MSDALVLALFLCVCVWQVMVGMPYPNPYDPELMERQRFAVVQADGQVLHTRARAERARASERGRARERERARERVRERERFPPQSRHTSR